MSYRDKIKERKRQEFRDKQQRNRIVAQLNQLKQAGYTDEQIRNKKVTVADGDTLSTIASANNTTEADLLSANPDMTKLQTGMVINAPGWQGAAITDGGAIPPPSGGIGLPSNAPLGGTTNNPQGTNRFGGTGNTPYGPARPPGFKPFGTTQTNPQTWGQPNINPQTWGLAKPPKVLQTNQYGGKGNTPYGPTPPPGYQAPPNPIAPVSGIGYQPHSVTKWQNYFKGLINQAELPTFNPTETELNWMLNLGLIKKSTSSGGGGGYGGYSYRGRGGGRGGGGGGGGYGRTPQGPRRRAFSTGSQFTGLVNWRL